MTMLLNATITLCVALRYNFVLVFRHIPKFTRPSLFFTAPACEADEMSEPPEWGETFRGFEQLFHRLSPYAPFFQPNMAEVSE